MYGVGLGVSQDYGEAMKWFRRAAEQGHGEARYIVTHSSGNDVPPALAREVAKWLRRAAERGDVVAQYTLGNMYSQGQGVAQDHAEAAIWYQRAAEQGAADAQLAIGTMYDRGLGVRRDDVQAHKWYDLAASRFQSPERQEAAARYRDRVAVRLSPNLLAQARRLAREWRPTNDPGTASPSAQ